MTRNQIEAPRGGGIFLLILSSLLRLTLLCWTDLESIMLRVVFRLATASSASAATLQRKRSVPLVI